MGIIKENEYLLIIKDGNGFGYIVGSIFVLIGLILIKPSFFGIHIQSNPPLFIAVMFILLGMSAIILPTLDSATFDKTANKLIVRERNLFWNRRVECSLDEIREMRLWIVRSDFPDTASPFYRLVCILKNGKEIGLNRTKSGFGAARLGPTSVAEIPNIQIGEKISKFLNVPFTQQCGTDQGT